MKQTVSIYAFRTAFLKLRPDNFSYEGLNVLFDYLEQYEQDCGEELELDVIAICCDYSEDGFESIADNYGIDLSDCEDESEKVDKVREYLEDEGCFIGESIEGVFVYRNL